MGICNCNLYTLINFRCIAPIFPPRQWNMHDVTDANQPQKKQCLKGVE